jgi:hypothetical protein
MNIKPLVLIDLLCKVLSLVGSEMKGCGRMIFLSLQRCQCPHHAWFRTACLPSAYLQSQNFWVQIPVPLLTSYATLSKIIISLYLNFHSATGKIGLWRLWTPSSAQSYNKNKMKYFIEILRTKPSLVNP